MSSLIFAMLVKADDYKDSIGLPITIYNGGQKFNLTGNGVKVAIIDSGADHPDLDYNIYNFIDLTGKGFNCTSCFEGCCADSNGHGTHVASIIAGNGASSGGKYKGVVPNAMLSIYRIDISDRESFVEAFEDAASSDVNIISTSVGWGASFDSEECRGVTADSQQLRVYQAIQKALSRNITVIAAASNNGPDSFTVSFPACIDGVIAVGSAITQDYADKLWPEHMGNDYHVAIEVNGSSPMTYNYGMNGTSIHSSFQKVIQTNSPSQIKTSINEQNLDWCQANSLGDMALTCTNVKQDQATLVIDCQEDCRDHFKNEFAKSPNELCNYYYGQNWYATGIDCENIDIDHVSDGDYTRNFDMVWNDSTANQANGWCVDGGGGDMTLTCTHLPAKPELKVQVRECNGNCNNEGTPNQICKELGSDWHAIEVDCETVTVSDSSGNRTFNDNVGSWCQDHGGEDLTVTCERGNMLNHVYNTTIVNCNGDCTNKGTPDKICQRVYGNGWYSQFVDCETINLNNLGDFLFIKRYLDASMSFPTSKNVVVDVYRPEGGGVNDIIIKFDSANEFSTKGVVSTFSGRGSVPGSSSIEPVVTAPGTDICAARASSEILTTIGECDTSCGNDKYMSCSGTSMATPVVAGVTALLKEVKPDVTPTEVMNAIRKADLKMSNSPNMNEGYGFINVPKAVNSITDCSKITKYVAKGYQDSSTDPNQCSSYNYNSYSSANQVRTYSWSDAINDCDCSVSYDSFISASVNGVSSGDVAVYNSNNISVDVDIKNTGSQIQNNWYIGVEFWNVSDYSNPWNTRSVRINAFYNGTSYPGTHGCIQNPDPLHPTSDYCPAQDGLVDCKITSESKTVNGKLDVGEIIKLRCQAPASLFPLSTGNNRIMFWVHERDTNQDANNDGIIGEWWFDALSTLEPAGVRVKSIANCLGDINKDGKVSLVDLVSLANAYGSKPGDAKWNPNADLDNSGAVSLTDLVILANHYGMNCTS